MNPIFVLLGLQFIKDIINDDDKEKDMEAPKFFLASKGIVGGILAGLAGIAGIFGYVVAPDLATQGVEIWLAVGSLIGGVLSIWSRVKTQSPLWFVKKDK
jgi:hypothetical protein